MATRDQKLRGMSLLIESLIEPNSELRGEAHAQKCYHELMMYRDECINYCRRRYTEIVEEQ